ncbi:wHTH domain-containing protein [Sorangium sp. So ce1335]|uniref:wHTH domain-containing protein n=1 Tax=Sorangium sp. So ce1335 TaxID=3133335 RepID=UPI003F60C643
MPRGRDPDEGAPRPAPRDVTGWAEQIRASRLWELAAADADSARTREETAALAAACAGVAAESTASAAEALGFEDPWRDDGLPGRTIACLEVLLGAARLDPPLDAVEAALLMIAPVARETLLRGALLDLARHHPASFAQRPGATGLRLELEAQHRMSRGLVAIVEAAPDADGPAARAIATALAHRAALASPETWGRLPPALRHAHGEAARALAALELVAPLPELAQVAGAPLDRRGPRAAAGFGARELSLLTLDDREIRVRETLVLHLSQIAGAMALDARALPDWVLATLGTSDPAGPVLWTTTRDGLAWSARADQLSVAGPCPHPAFDLHLDALLGRLRSLLDHAAACWTSRRGASRGAAPFPSRVDRRQLRPTQLADGRPCYEQPPPQLAIPQDRLVDIAPRLVAPGSPSDVALELYRNAVDACRYRQTRQAYAERALGAPPRPFTGEIRIEHGQDDRGVFVACRDAGAGMDVATFQACFAAAGAPLWRQPGFLVERARWAAAGPSSPGFTPMGRDGHGVAALVATATELEIESQAIDADGRPGERFAARITSAGRVIRLTRLPPGGDGGTQVRVYCRGAALQDDFLDRLAAHLWVAPFPTVAATRSGSMTWPAGALAAHAGDASVATRNPAFWWVEGTGALLANGLRVGRALPGMVLDVAPQEPASFDDRQIGAIAGREIDALAGAGIVSTAWLWRLEDTHPKLCGTIVAALRDGDARVRHRLPGPSTDEPRTYEVPIAALGVSRLDVGIFVGMGTPPHAATGAPDPRARRHLVYSSTEPTDVSYGPSGPLAAPQPQVFSEHLRAALPAWLLPARLAAWASVGVEERDWAFHPEHLGAPLPACPPLLPGDAIALSRDLDGCSPWVTTEISPEHVVQAAMRLDEPVGDVLARFQRFAGLGVRLSDVDWSLLVNAELSADEARLVFFRGAPEWQQVLVAAERGCTYGEAYAWLRRFEPLGIAAVPPPGGAAALRFSPQEVAALTQQVDHARARIGAADLIDAALSAGMTADALHDLARRLGAVGVEVPTIDIEQLRRWIEDPADFTLLSEFLDRDRRLSRVSLVCLSAEKGLPLAAVRDLTDACAALGLPCDPLPEAPPDLRLDASHLRLLSRDLDGRAPWKERPLDVWDVVAAHDVVGAEALAGLGTLAQLGLVEPRVACQLRAVWERLGLVSCAVLHRERCLSAAHLLWISARTATPLGRLADDLRPLLAADVPCPAAAALEGAHDAQAYVAGPADLAVVTSRGGHDTVLPEEALTLLQLLGAHNAVGDEVLRTVALLRRLGSAVPDLSQLALACLSAAGDGMAPWITGPLPIPSTHLLRVAADAGVTVGEVATALLRATEGARVYSLQNLHARRWAALTDTRVSTSQVALLANLDLPDDIGDEGAVAFPSLLFAAIRTGTPVDKLRESLSWLTSLGVRLPPSTGISEWVAEDVMLLSKHLDGRPPWIGPVIGAGHLLRAAHRLALPLGSTLDRAARLARAGYRIDVPALNADPGAITQEDLVAASSRLDGEAPWLQGRVDAAHVEAAAAANRETTDVTWRRLQRLAPVLALELPPDAPAAPSLREAPSAAKADAATSERRAVLFVVGRKGPPRRFLLSSPEVIIGRDQHCDVSLDDTQASRRHCRLARRADGGFLLVDECSRNGVYVGGKRVFTQRLTEDADIHVGTTRLQLRFTSGAASEAGGEGSDGPG